MPSQAKEAIRDFLDSIPDSKLTALPTTPGRNVQKNVNLRLDMQNMTKANEHNLQVQVNKGCKITTLKKYAPKSVCFALIPADGSMSAQQIRQKLIDSVKI